MPEIGSGIFYILIAMGFGGLVISKPFGALFAIISAVAFFAISLMMFADYDVSSTTVYTDATTVWNQTDYVIGKEGTSTEEIQQKQWVAWIFFILFLVSIAVFLVESLKIGKST